MFVRSLDIELMCNPTIHSLGMTTEKYIHVPRKNTYMHMHKFIFSSQKAETAQKSISQKGKNAGIQTLG